MGAAMKTGQVVKFRPGLRIAAGNSIPNDAAGIVVCSYKLLSDRTGRCERIDVDFRSYGMLWAQPADAFESMSEAQAAPAA